MFDENKVIKCGFCKKYVPVTPDFRKKLEQLKAMGQVVGANPMYRCGNCKRAMEGEKK